MSGNRSTGLVVIGGGLAGCEAAWQAALRGIQVDLYEMRPEVSTGAHTGDGLAELVCSNSLGSELPDRASGLLKDELRRMGSLLLTCAAEAQVPAGRALAVDRLEFSRLVTEKIQSHSKIRVYRREVRDMPPGPVIIASGPLTSPALSESIARLTGQEHLYFYDAIAPIMRIDTIDSEIAYRASRYAKEEQGDYINCPMSREEYADFVDALVAAERFPLHEVDNGIENGVLAGKAEYFEGCLPIEILARRDRQALAYGPLRPIGLVDKRTGKAAFAVVQLRQDNLAGTLYNMVGFQTNLTIPEQKRVFRMIPGLKDAEFERYGQMHRNTFVFSPEVLFPTLQCRLSRDLFFAGQITGVEGYVGNIATGLLAGINAARFIQGESLVELPRETMLGALCYYITHASAKDFQPMKANFGILPELESHGLPPIRGRRPRSIAFARRASESLDEIVENI
jgi:methylenetetrahydrofolate--tRNA-(uracil-5-)-methyltransferase